MLQLFDVVCVGGGVIGLMSGMELARQQVRVAVLDQSAIGNEASWAGAGIISPPPAPDALQTAFDRLRQYSFNRFPELADQLRQETGIDIGYRQTGAIELATDAHTRAELSRATTIWEKQKVQFQPLDAGRLRELEPNLEVPEATGYWLPQACQVRNPRLLQALIASCQQSDVHLAPRQPVRAIRIDSGDVRLDLADGSAIRCKHAVITAGAWSSRLLSSVPLPFTTFPVKGQIVTFQTQPGTVRSIVHLGKRYLVPRPDGLVLAGSTEEVGTFDTQVTAEEASELRSFATSLFPKLAESPPSPMWAGVRPGSDPPGPIIGPVPDCDQVWVATGHFRQGLQLSPGTARLIVDGILGKKSFADIADFSHSADRSRFESGFHS